MQEEQNPLTNPQIDPMQPGQQPANMFPVQKQGMSTGAKVAIGLVGCLLLCGLCLGGVTILSAVSINKAAKIGKNGSELNIKNLENPKSMDEEVEISSIRWKVLESEDIGKEILANETYYTPCKAASGMKFVKVKFNVKNNSDTTKSLSTLKVLDQDNKEYDYYFGTFSCISETKLSANDKLFNGYESINPGVQKDFTAYFEVPENSTQIKLQISDLMFFGTVSDYIKLELN